MRCLKGLLTFAFFAVISLVVIAPPTHVGAQSLAAAPALSATANPPTTGTGSAQNPDSEKNDDDQFLHAPAVQSLARLLHLDLQTTIDILLGINFAVIFLLIAVPLGRYMPKILRKRSRNLSHDLEIAREATADAKARLSAVQAKLAGLGEEIAKYRAEVEQEALEDEKRIKASLGEECARIVSAAEQEIGVAVAQAKRGLRSFAADLAIEQASQQIRLTPETDRALIHEFVTSVSPDGSGKGGNN
jgi:F-type H+-transporting ATPase subunit b